MARATTSSHEEIRAETVQQIRALTDQFNAERKSKVEERAALFRARQTGIPTFEVLPPDEVAAHEFALQRLNGAAPEHLRKMVLPGQDPDQRLAIEIRGLDLVLAALGQKELVATAAEAYQRVADETDEYRAMARDYILSAERTLAYEQRLADYRQQTLRGITPSNLPLAELIGVPGRTIFDRRRGADPLSREREGALQAGIITESDIRRARA